MSEPVRPLLTAAADQLRAAGVQSPAQDARVLLAFVSGVELVRLPLLAELDDDHVRRFRRLVAQRADRVPLQHLTGRAHFRTITVEVGPGVFVPRPETEVMTGWAIERLAAMITLTHRPLAVELGTGSGAIAKAIATELTRVDLHAVERSEAAAGYARRNLADTLVELHVADMATALPELDGTVDLVIANPPYIPLDAYASVPPEVRDHDPTEALFSGSDGLDAIRVVTQRGGPAAPPGRLRLYRARRRAGRVGGGGPGALRHVPRCTRPPRPDGAAALRHRHSSMTGTERNTWQDGPVSTTAEEPRVGRFERFDCTGPEPDAYADAIEAARKAIEDGACIVLPTDTVYGIGADAFSPAAVQRLLDAKHRGRDMPPPVLIAESSLIRALATEVPQGAKDLVAEHWPGPLTVICQIQPSLRMDLGDSKDTIALRVPDHPLTREILRRTGPMAVSSANRSGSPAALNCDEAIDQLGDAVAVYLDGGPLTAYEGAASTIVDFTQHDDGEVLRLGALSVEILRKTLPDLHAEQFEEADEGLLRQAQDTASTDSGNSEGPEDIESPEDIETPVTSSGDTEP